MSSNTKTIIINQITNFIDELINTYPQNNELKLLERNYNKFHINKNLSNTELENKIMAKENIEEIRKKN